MFARGVLFFAFDKFNNVSRAGFSGFTIKRRSLNFVLFVVQSLYAAAFGSYHQSSSLVSGPFCVVVLFVLTTFPLLSFFSFEVCVCVCVCVCWDHQPCFVFR